jgi:hypothetical protein
MTTTEFESYNFSPSFSKEPFVANPHALLTNNVVTDVVFMQDYDEEEIKEVLSRYSYDEVMRWDDYGYAMYETYVKIGKWVVRPQPSPTHTLNQTTGDWEATFDPNYVCPPCPTHNEKSN